MLVPVILVFLTVLLLLPDLLLLRLSRHNEPIVVLAMLQIALCPNAITRRLGISRQRLVLLKNMARCTSNFYIRAVALQAAVKLMLRFASTTARALLVLILLPLPHITPALSSN